MLNRFLSFRTFLLSSHTKAHQSEEFEITLEIWKDQMTSEDYVHPGVGDDETVNKS